MVDTERVKMTHKDIPDQPIYVREVSVQVHEASGWERAAEAPTEPTAEPEVVKTPSPGPAPAPAPVTEKKGA